ncbi:MAG: hypothetical protein CMI52_04985 [Parcubacteria group bacterium]|nr:hypothetical protein [Parcubacteria group bacterium]
MSVRLKIKTPRQTFERILTLVNNDTRVHTRNPELREISCGELSDEILGRVVALGGAVNKEDPFDWENTDKFIHFEFDGRHYGAKRGEFLKTGSVLLPEGFVVRVNSWNETEPPTPRTWSVVPMAKAFLLP